MKYQGVIENDYEVFLNFLKAKYPVFHNSNFFFRDLQYGIQKYLEKKGMDISNQDAEQLAYDVARFLENKGIFVPVNKLGWRVNYTEFVTAAPGDPF